MGLRPVYGHEALLDRLGGALASGRFPQGTLLLGPAGVGKQRVALWIAQGLLCEGGPGNPCGDCRGCHRVVQLAHPDLHWFVPIPRPKAGDPGKQVDEASEALGEVMEARRRDGLWRQPERMASHSLASVRLLRRVAALTPFEGARKVVIVGDAERLIVQEASQESANALLKLLEEPPADTTILLTTADPETLLPTIRSRLVPLRVPRVSDQAIRAFLGREPDPPLEGRVLDRRTILAEGSIGRALWGAEDGEGIDQEADALLAAIERGPGAWLPQALAQGQWAARGQFTELLDALAVRLRVRLRAAADAGEQPHRWVMALRRLDEAREAAQGNANPQLQLATLAGDLERVL